MPMQNFAPLPKRLFTEADSVTVIAVAAAIAFKRVSKTGVAEVGIAEICKLARVSRGTAIAAVKWLVDHGIVTADHSTEHSQRRVFRFPDLDKTGPNEVPVSLVQPVQTEDRFKTDTGSIEVQNRSNSDAKPVQTKHRPLNTERKKRVKKDSARAAHAKSNEDDPPDSRHTLFRRDFETYFATKTPGAVAPWDGREGANLKSWLKANSTITQEQWQKILQNRARSPVAHGERLSIWIDRATCWLSGPADSWGKPIAGGSNGNGIKSHAPGKTLGNFDEARAAIEQLDCATADLAECGSAGERDAGRVPALQLGTGHVSGR